MPATGALGGAGNPGLPCAKSHSVLRGVKPEEPVVVFLPRHTGRQVDLKHARVGGDHHTMPDGEKILGHVTREITVNALR
jgi:hypothetical protein